MVGMSSAADKLTTIKLTPQNLERVDRRVAVFKECGLIVSRNAVANELIEAGSILRLADNPPKKAIKNASS